MNSLVFQKAVALTCLFIVGLFLRQKISDDASKNVIKNFILNAALPASIFISTINIDIKSNLIALPIFALATNIYLLSIGGFLSFFLMRGEKDAKKRTLILFFPSLAPGLTVYPFIEQFSGDHGLALAALADIGNKTFVLIGLYALAIYWHKKKNQLATSNGSQWNKVISFILTEPVNIAIYIALLLAGLNLAEDSLPFAMSDFIKKLAACSTPLILIYVGLSINLKSIQVGIMSRILLIKAGAGFLFSSAAITLLKPNSPEMIILFTALPQASFSFWPLLHATKINNSDDSTSSNVSSRTNVFFDTEYATALLTVSFPFSIFTLLLIFSNGKFLFYSSLHLMLIGSILLGICFVSLSCQRLNSISANLRSLLIRN